MHYCWWAARSINIILKYYHYLTVRKSDFSYLSNCLSWSLVLTQRCTLTWVMKILMWAISNVHVDRIWPAGRRFPIPAIYSAVNTRLWAIWNMLTQMGYSPSVTCECGTEEQTIDHVILHCPIQWFSTTVLRAWITRQSNGCSTPAPRSSAA